MKLKYYMRGLGIGIIVTALLMGFATKDSGKMSDEEVKMRAVELGMVEQRTLANVREDGPTSEPATTEAPVVTEAPATTEVPVATEAPATTEVPATTEAPTRETVVTEATESDVVVLIKVARGDSSESVSRKLENAGLIEDASKFNKYLLDNNLDEGVRIGEYNIKKGLSEEEIAQIIAK